MNFKLSCQSALYLTSQQLKPCSTRFPSYFCCSYYSPSFAVGYASSSFAQQRLWFLRTNCSLVIPITTSIPLFTFKVALDISALEFSLRTVVAHHKASFYYFVVQDGLPRQLISSSMPFSIKQLYLDNKPNSDQDAVQAAKIEVQRLFNYWNMGRYSVSSLFTWIFNIYLL